MKKVVSLILAAAMGITLLAAPAMAKDDVLEQDLVALEKGYIPPLFFTSSMLMQPSVKAMADYKAAWRSFSDKYYFYKPDYANWQSYFDQIEWAVQDADKIVQRAKATGDASILPLAHEELEKVRMVMLDLRGKNGFPKFITDKLTYFHNPMEHIVLSVKGKTPAQIDEALLAELALTLKDVWKTWDTAQKCPFDVQLWKLTPAQVTNYYKYAAAEQDALEKFESALASGNKTLIIQTGVAIKPNFVECYKTFGDFAKYMK